MTLLGESHHSYSSSANFDQSLFECTMLKQQLAKRQSMIQGGEA